MGPGKRRLVRYLAISFALAVSAVGFQAPVAANASAAVECCGLVIRYDSIQNVVVAANINATNVGKGSNCNIWNWGGGNVWNPVNPGGNCDTRSMNGHTYSWNIWADTDAFTVQYEAYWLNFHGSWRRLNANVYTKINGLETAKCYRESDGVNCYVVY
ncbi:hypothetical protein GCM10009555_016890 [Acrocarpospora macrocephala]|uniref:Streptomyces killer toxin-like beta/gamma crystallin domain-containing protein n=1 Tax=Acrocarpospora macrocephala TaxID=150177 RepID=A0A5M3WGD8_9ACTN|nr:hypothetical protein [Acrocarpospora macrocephala]GES07349.1 hypothetical protein Amac_009440 [Acrocarpospora macrocephala]